MTQQIFQNVGEMDQTETAGIDSKTAIFQPVHYHPVRFVKPSVLWLFLCLACMANILMLAFNLTQVKDASRTVGSSEGYQPATKI